MIELKGELLQRLHEVETEMLVEIDRVCRKNNINYYMIAGTLLGAVRHKGFIPWDDDMDITMSRADFKRFLEVSEKDLCPDYYIECDETNPDYWYAIPKVCKKNTVFKNIQDSGLDENIGIYIDIFMLDNVPKADSKIQAVRASLANLIQATMSNRKTNFNVKDMSLKSRLFYYLTKPMSIGKLAAWRKRIITHYGDECEYYTNLASRYGRIKQTMRKDVYYPPVELEFDGHKFLAPNKYEYVLERLYGDYMKLPDEDKRRTTHRIFALDFGDDK